MRARLASPCIATYGTLRDANSESTHDGALPPTSHAASISAASTGRASALAELQSGLVAAGYAVTG
ncbi:MAG TPA: hypothetical protein VFD36_02290, partial [Kofleriaceae bacterium]|nr:hypothetical protein [Kofleriaceae bacterium]